MSIYRSAALALGNGPRTSLNRRHACNSGREGYGWRYDVGTASRSPLRLRRRGGFRRWLETLIKGSAIRTIKTDKSSVSLELNDDFNLEVHASNNLLEPKLVSSIKDKLPSMRLQLAKEGELPAAWMIERRIHALRQLYAIAFLLNFDRGDELADVLKSEPHVDLEAKLLKEDEWLFITGASVGSWYITLLTKTREVFVA
jgi:hypothetical protein